MGELAEQVAEAEANYTMDNAKARVFLSAWAGLPEFDFMDKMAIRHAIKAIDDNEKLQFALESISGATNADYAIRRANEALDELGVPGYVGEYPCKCITDDDLVFEP